MKLIETMLEGVVIIESDVLHDHRGFFMESYNEGKMIELGLHVNFVQDNHSFSVEKGTLRGLHYQLNPMAQTKLIRVLAGAIYDVVVDIRKDSATFGQWEGFNLNSENKRQLFVPKGFAHGFCTIIPNTEVLYKVDQYYSPYNDRGILWNDPELGINWPALTPILSEKDRGHPMLKNAEIHY